jgi:hypothetical protein
VQETGVPVNVNGYIIPAGDRLWYELASRTR